MRKSLSIAVAVLMISIAGCKQENADKEKTPPTQTENKKPAAATQSSQAETAAPGTQNTSQDIENVTNNACLAAVKKETGESDVSVVSNEFSEANTVVMIGVGAQRAPWRCLVSNKGQVAEVSFEGDDSAGASNQPAPSDNATGGSDVSQTAINACLAAVSKETGESDVAVLGSEFSEANSEVTVGVGQQRAPWRCLVSNDGKVSEVSSQSDEGKL